METAANKVFQILNQAKASFKVLESRFEFDQEETLARVRRFLRIPAPGELRRLRNKRILSSLRKMGVATRSDIESLDQKVQSLEAALQAQKEANPASSHKTTQRK